MMRRVVSTLLLLSYAAFVQSAEAQTKVLIVRVTPRVAANRCMKRVRPKYPAGAKAQHIEGAVVLKVNIDKQGNVADSRLVSGPPVLVTAAIEAVKQWKYDPFLLNGDPIAMETQVTVSFALPK